MKPVNSAVLAVLALCLGFPFLPTPQRTRRKLLLTVGIMQRLCEPGGSGQPWAMRTRKPMWDFYTSRDFPSAKTMQRP